MGGWLCDLVEWFCGGGAGREGRTFVYEFLREGSSTACTIVSVMHSAGSLLCMFVFFGRQKFHEALPSGVLRKH